MTAGVASGARRRSRISGRRRRTWQTSAFTSAQHSPPRPPHHILRLHDSLATYRSASRDNEVRGHRPDLLVLLRAGVQGPCPPLGQKAHRHGGRGRRHALSSYF
jgi:hypothetical protein